MARLAGVSAVETRDRLLQAAADVFAEHGYDGARVADIAAAAGVSNSALYAHYPSKADLLVAALRAHGRQMLASLFAANPDRSTGDLLLLMGRWLQHRPAEASALIVEALVAARRDPEVALLMRDHVAERAEWLTDLIDAAQRSGEFDPALSRDAMAHFCLLLGFGSALLPADAHPVDRDAWNTLLGRIIASFAPATAPPPREAST